MKLELLVIADQNAAVNAFPGLYTPPVTPRELGGPKVNYPTVRGKLPKAKSMTGVKS